MFKIKITGQASDMAALVELLDEIADLVESMDFSDEQMHSIGEPVEMEGNGATSSGYVSVARGEVVVK